jgi:hypothetical protein
MALTNHSRRLPGLKSGFFFLCLVSLLLSCQSLVSDMPSSERETSLPEQSAVEPEIVCAEFVYQDGAGRLVPKVVGNHSLAYDSARRKIVLFGGAVNCTWEYDGEKWTLIETEVSPPPSWGTPLVYDSTRNVTRLISARNSGEVWQYDGLNWKALPVEGAFRPISTGWLTAAYIPEEQATYVVGVCELFCSDEGYYSGWLFDGYGWIEERIIPYGGKGSPNEPTLMTPEVVYDEDRILLANLLRGDLAGKR